MNNMLLKQLSTAVGVDLKVRDNDKLKEETADHLAERLARKAQTARDSGVVDAGEAVERFYCGASRKD